MPAKSPNIKKFKLVKKKLIFNFFYLQFFNFALNFEKKYEIFFEFVGRKIFLQVIFWWFLPHYRQNNFLFAYILVKIASKNHQKKLPAKNFFASLAEIELLRFFQCKIKKLQVKKIQKISIFFTSLNFVINGLFQGKIIFYFHIFNFFLMIFTPIISIWK